MKQLLSLNWDWGIAISEFVSSFILLFLVMVFLTSSLKKKFMPIVFAISTLFSIVFGWSIGSHIGGREHALSLITPISAILISFHENAFNALWYIVLFQIFGSAFGFLWFCIYKKFLLKNNNFLPQKEEIFSGKHVAWKSLIFQPILIFSLLYIPLLDWTSYQTGLLLNAIITSLVIGLILFLTKDFGFIIFSPWISIAYIIISKSFDKKIVIFKKISISKQIVNFFIEFIIQITIMEIIICLDVFVFKGLY